MKVEIVTEKVVEVITYEHRCDRCDKIVKNNIDTFIIGKVKPTIKKSDWVLSGNSILELCNQCRSYVLDGLTTVLGATPIQLKKDYTRK